MNESYSSKLNFGLSGQSKSDKVLGKGAINEISSLRSEEIREKARLNSESRGFKMQENVLNRLAADHSRNSMFANRDSLGSLDTSAAGRNALNQRGVDVSRANLDAIISGARAKAAKATQMEAAKKSEQLAKKREALFKGSQSVEKKAAMKFVGREIKSNPALMKRLKIYNSEKLEKMTDIITGEGAYTHSPDIKEDSKAFREGHPERTKILSRMSEEQRHVSQFDRKTQLEIAAVLDRMYKE
jgi:hypothetical protein